MKENDEPQIIEVGPATPRRGRRSLAEQTAGQDPAALEAEVARDNHLALVEEKYGDDLPFDQHRVEDEVKFYLGQSAMAYFEAGKRLIRIKEHVGHGSFMASLERIGLEQSVANKTMFTVRKFVEARIANSETIPNLSPTKLYEIALLEPEEIEELGAGGVVAGKTLDDLEKMTVREVKEAFRKEREDRKAKDQAREEAIAKKEETINRLERQLRGLPEPSRREVNGELLKEIHTKFVGRCMDILVSIQLLREILDEAAALPELEGAQLEGWKSKMVDLGTEAVIVKWEEVMEYMTDLRPAQR